MEVIVRYGSYEDVARAEEILREKQYVSPSFEGVEHEFLINAYSGKTEVRESHRVVLASGRSGAFVFFREPGELCVKIRGLSTQVKKTLEDLGVPTSSLAECIFDLVVV